MALQVLQLKCNHMKEPIGIDDLPYFSYQISTDKASTCPIAYRIVVNSANETVWDSGSVSSEEQILIPYGGKPLQPMTRYTWSVTVRTDDGAEATSEESFFETGVMRQFGWNAKWITNSSSAIFIGNHIKRKKEYPAPYLRRTFEVKKEVRDATLYISGVGYYECFVNGASVKDTYLDPAFTEYDKAVLYKTHKITNLRLGKNAIGVILGDGFFNANSYDVWNFINATWRSLPMCILILRIEYADGTVEEIPSDTRFVGTTGPILRDDVRTSEVYDANLELGDWTSADYDDRAWQPAKITKAPGGALIGTYTTPIRKVAEYAPKMLQPITDHVWLADVGENTVGWAEIRMTAPKGTRLRLRYLENVNDALKETQGLETCLDPMEAEHFQTDYYIAKGEGVEVWHPIFKYNGYRYIVIECEDEIPSDLTLSIQEIRTDLPIAGGFECSNADINRLQEICCRSTRTNFHHMPTDCPHREKNGWTGDAQLSAEQLLYNFDGAAAYDRWVDDIIRAQRPTGQLPGIIPSTGWGFNWGSGPAWDSVCAIIPYTMYLYCGDRRVLSRVYPTVKRYLDFCDSMAEDNICAFGLADWCYPKTETHKKCANNISDTGYFYLDTRIAAKMAHILGYEEEALHYEAKAKEIRASFRNFFIEKDEHGIRLRNCAPSQAAYATVLYFGMAEADEKEFFLTALKQEIHEKEDHLDVGILGMKYINQILMESGDAELLLKCHLTPTYPSLGYMLASGATTLWEDYEGKISQNHHMFGDVSATFYKMLAGIQVDEDAPAFKNTFFRPQFVTGMTYAKGWHDSPYGRVASAWERNGNDVTLTLTVPVGCTGRLELPKNAVLADGATKCSLCGGTHTLSVRIQS